jgi:hypothetical protein
VERSDLAMAREQICSGTEGLTQMIQVCKSLVFLHVKESRIEI